jgi:hypothetical protein
VVNGLALTCKYHVWHSWEGPETSTGAYGICCKSAHTVHVVNNFNFNFGHCAKEGFAKLYGIELDLVKSESSDSNRFYSCT